MSDPGTSTPIRILYIDDEPALLDLTKLFLEDTGNYTVDVLEDSLEAAEMIMEGDYDAVISDYQMPSKDGITLLKEIRSAGSTIPFIIFTGKGREDIVIEALNNGADFYLQKGGNPRAQFAELSHQIQSAVTARRAERKIAESLDELNAAYEQLTASEEELRSSFDELSIREQEVRRSKRRLSDIINFLPDATFAIDSDGIVIAWNLAIEEMTGIESDKVIGKGEYEYSLLFYGERRPVLIDYILKGELEDTQGHYPEIHKRGENVVIETDSARMKGEKRVLWATASRFYDENGKVAGAIESIRDITKQRKQELELLAMHEELASTEEEIRQHLDEAITAQEQLRKSEERYRGIFENTGSALAIFGQDLTILKVNALFEELSGYSAAEIEGRLKTTAFIHPDDLDRLIGYHHARIQNGEAPRNYEFRFIRRNGEERIILISIGVLPEEQRSISSLVDITGWRRAEERTQELVHILEESKNEIYIFDAETLRFLWVNRGACTNLGFSMETLAGMTPLDLKPEFTPQAFRKLISPMVDGEKEYNEFRTVHRRADGSLYPIEVHLQISRFHGKPAFVAIIIDRTDIARAEEEMNTREKILSKVMEILPIGLWFADSKGRLTMGNPAGIAIWGAEPHVGIEDYGIFKARRYPSGEEIAPDDWALAHSIRDRATITDELLEIDCFDGQKRLIYNYTAPVILDDGTLEGAIVVNRDVTEEKRSEEALRLSNKKIRLLAGITRHDVRNQMTAIEGYIELIRRKEPDSAVAELLEKIARSTAQILKSFEFMKEYEKIGTSGPTLQEINSSLEPLAGSQIPITNTCRKLSIIADPLLTKVFSNLLDNTIRHGEDATSITISCEEKDGNLSIIWQDNGTGIPDTMKERIFEYKCGKNNGYGLYLVREILGITGITIHEEGIAGEGARFVLSVPAGRWKIG
ncbi:PAS domain S-box protein [Methanocalculus taiwanensis]|uniref:histidine kinase n=1 Tax=Methanocalculus taiwanensis TaxID=106207 RepID=A0ABD4TM40_9EURY|nr:PAS domain S-box protein [Methanocalculus taiwanensis]MCQ1538365.1 PAS domain S-box protein [Methanocalculus taiwanensis]